MAKLYVPACGDRITLSAPWTFTLRLEWRNRRFAEEVGLAPKTGSRWPASSSDKVPHTLPAGTVLEVDRVYVRNFNKSKLRVEDDYDSVTFRVIGPKGKPLRLQRFWVKLVDCNRIEYGEATTFRERSKLAAEVLGS